ncbi:MAG: oligosaccharide flippase family protein [Spirochaetes bacterium]|nr:oligosaccharide flippase family protein [Spirochaetota bacterium]
MKFIYSFFSGHERTTRINKNIAASFVIKFVSIFTGFILVPLCLSYLDRTRYGVWLTVSSVLSWLTFFELGMGTGLRNKLSESFAEEKSEKAKIYVSTTYVIFSVLAILILIVYYVSGLFLDWADVFNVEKSLREDLNLLINLVFVVFVLRFVFKLIVSILYADQRPALAGSIIPAGSLLSVGVVYFLTKTTEGSLSSLGIALSLSPLTVLIGFNIILFSKKYKYIRPSLKFFRFRYVRILMNLGMKFFIIQLAGLILYQSTNIIISHFFGPGEVTPYSISFKLFSTFNMIFGVVLAPYWNAHTEAWKKNDITWIKASVKKLLRIWLLMAAAGFIVLIFSDDIYRLWVGEEIAISFSLSALLLIYFLLFTFTGIFNMFINGVGKIKLQLYTSVISAAYFFPLTFFLIGKANMRLEGLALAMILTNIIGPITAPIQFYKIVNGKAKGIWNA